MISISLADKHLSIINIAFLAVVASRINLVRLLLSSKNDIEGQRGNITNFITLLKYTTKGRRMDNLETDCAEWHRISSNKSPLSTNRIPLLKIGEMITFEGLLSDVESINQIDLWSVAILFLLTGTGHKELSICDNTDECVWSQPNCEILLII